MTSPRAPSLSLELGSAGSSRFSPAVGSPTAFRELPISFSDMSAMRARLLGIDGESAKYIRTTKDSVDKKTNLQKWFQYYQTAFNQICSAYSVLAKELVTSDKCAHAISLARSEITRTCIANIKDAFKSSLDEAVRSQIREACSAGVREALERVSVPSGSMSYAGVVSSAPGVAVGEVRVSRGPIVMIDKSTSFFITPSESAAARFTSSQLTKEAVIKNVDPGEVGLRVDRISRSRGNGIRVDAVEADMDKLKSLPVLRNLGLEVSEVTRLNPRLIIHGVPADLSADEI